QLTCRGAEPGDVRVVATQRSRLVPEGVARARARRTGRGVVQDPACGLLVRDRHVAAATRERDPAHEPGQRLGRATQRYVDAVRTSGAERGVLDRWREGVADGIPEEREQPGRGRDLHHGARIGVRRSNTPAIAWRSWSNVRR